MNWIISETIISSITRIFTNSTKTLSATSVTRGTATYLRRKENALAVENYAILRDARLSQRVMGAKSVLGVALYKLNREIITHLMG